MKLVLCIDKGNGAHFGKLTPEKGVIYKVDEAKPYGIICEGVDLWYDLDQTPGFSHHISLFVDVPDDLLTNLRRYEIESLSENYVLCFQ